MNNAIDIQWESSGLESIMSCNQPAAEKQHGRAVTYRYIVIFVLEMVKF